MLDKKHNRSAWAVGGGLLAGLGIGFFFLEKSALAFLGCMIAGLGFGLFVAVVIPVIQGENGSRSS